MKQDPHIRTAIATQAMNALIPIYGVAQTTPTDVAKIAVRYADALIAELVRTEKR